MRPFRRTGRLGWLGALLLGIGVSAAAHAQSVLTYHGSSDRSGNFAVPALTWDRARNIRLDPSFHPLISGHLYAQPLYWRPPGSSSGQLFVATEDNNVYAIDAGSGHEIWVRSLGRPVPLSTLDCGNIDPLGITGTPVIDQATQAIYVAAMVGEAAGPHHQVFALSLKDGSPLPGWSVDVAEALAARGQRFNARDQNQRGALAILDGHVYVPYGGHYGDCGDYHGWVVGISVQNPRDVVSWSTRGRGGGIFGRDRQRRPLAVRRHRQYDRCLDLERRRGGLSSRPGSSASRPAGRFLRPNRLAHARFA